MNKVLITLKDVLEREGMSQRELAKRTGIRFPSINDIANNKAERPPLDNFAKICEVLQCEFGDLVKLVTEAEYENYITSHNK